MAKEMSKLMADYGLNEPSGSRELVHVNGREAAMLDQMRTHNYASGGSATAPEAVIADGMGRGISPSRGISSYKGQEEGVQSVDPMRMTADAKVSPSRGTSGYKGQEDGSFLNLTPVSSLSTQLNQRQSAPNAISTPTLNLIPTAQSTAATYGGFELGNMLKHYGVSTPAAAAYTGAAVPTFTAVAPTLPGNARGSRLVSKTDADKYRDDLAAYNTAVDTYNAQLDKNAQDQASYDAYLQEYNRRMAGGSLTGSEYADILQAPTYAKGGSVHDLAAKYADGGEVASAAGVDPYDIASAQKRYQKVQTALEDMYARSLDTAPQDKASQAEKYFRVAAALAAPTRTGGFMENVGLAAQQLAESSAADRAARDNKTKLELEIQKYRVAAAKGDLESAVEARKNMEDLSWKQKEFDLRERQLAETTAYHKAAIAERAAARGASGDKHPKLTEAESRTAGLYQVAAQADNVLSSFAAGVDPVTGKRLAAPVYREGSIPAALGNIPWAGESIKQMASPMQSGEEQRVKQAQDTFGLMAIYHLTGKGVTVMEAKKTVEALMPKYGDDPKTIAQKAQSRKVILESMRTGAGRALQPAAGTTPAAKPVTIPQVNSRGWVLKVDKNGNKAYVSPDNTQFEEVD